MTSQNEAGALTGTIVGGRYRLTRQLGQGGMGEVYAAEHIHITKKVAVKLLHTEISNNAEAVARFKQEAQSASSIGHQNIIRIDDFFENDDGRVCMCMEFVDGQSLDTVIHAIGRDDPLRGLRMMCQVCDGLAAAHAKGIIHRDMKPENVFLVRQADGTEQAKILDFGIAKVTGSDGHDLTKTGMVFGTPHYMSPEQALGHEVDCRADVYSLGVMLFEMFTGQVPFKAESFMGVLSQHITASPPLPSSLTPAGKVPAPVEQLILKAMDKSPDERFSTVEALKEALIEAQIAFGGNRFIPKRPAAPTRLGAVSPLEASPLESGATVYPAATDPRAAGGVPVANAPTMDSRQMAAKVAPASSVLAPSLAPASLTHDTEISPPKSRSILFMVVALAVLFVGASVYGWYWYASRGQPSTHVGVEPIATGANAATTDDTRVETGAVLPTVASPDAAPRVAGYDDAARDAVADAATDEPERPVANVMPSAIDAAASDEHDAAPTPIRARPVLRVDASLRADAMGARAAEATGVAADAAVSEQPAPAKRTPKRDTPPPPKVRDAYDVRVVSVPSDAAVFRDGRKLRQRTPLTLKLKPGQRVRLRLAKGGREDTNVTVVGKNADQTVRVTLKRRTFGIPSGGGNNDDGFEDF